MNEIKYLVCILLSVFVHFNVQGSVVHPLTKIVKLSLAISKASYLPIPGKRYLQAGALMENPTTVLPRRLFGFILLNPKYDRNQDKVACSIRGWNAKYHEAKDTELFLFTNAREKVAVFGFRGTEALKIRDWIYNLNIFATQTNVTGSTFAIHKGFLQRYHSVAAWFETQYTNIPRNYTIIITGYSLGGAMAQIAAVFAAGKLERRPDAVVTFGSPLVGEPSFKSYYMEVVGCERTLRFVARRDIFIHVPSFLGYVHPCPELQIDGQTGFDLLNAHGLYTAYDKGIEKRYKSDEIDFGCDKSLK